jgi:hypothetical protein
LGKKVKEVFSMMYAFLLPLPRMEMSFLYPREKRPGEGTGNSQQRKKRVNYGSNKRVPSS